MVRHAILEAVVGNQVQASRSLPFFHLEAVKPCSSLEIAGPGKDP